MVRYIETDDGVSDFLSAYRAGRAALFPVWRDRVTHPIQNRLTAVLVFIGGDCWVLSLHHNDCLPMGLDLLQESGGERWVFDTKWMHHGWWLPHYRSVDAAHWLTRWETISYEGLYGRLTIGGRRIGDTANYPITRLVEEIEGVVKGVLTGLDLSPSGFGPMNDLILPTFADIERNGIPTTEGVEYSLYNNFTVTGRPTNGFGGVNYSALNRSDGSRDRIVASGEFYQWDYDGYHIRLIAKLVGETIPDPSAHEWLGRQYFGKPELTDEEYRESKAITFRQLYGGLDTEVMDIPFYNKADGFIRKMYQDFIVKGYLETRMGRRIPHTKIPDHTPQKVFNYYLQALETETNVIILQQLTELLRGKESRLTLYTYDSFLIDIHPLETDLITEIERILHRVGPTELKRATNYGKIG